MTQDEADAALMTAVRLLGAAIFVLVVASHYVSSSPKDAAP